MKCKRRKALFGLDDAAIIGLIGSIIGAGSNIYKANQNKKAIQQQQRAENMAAIDQQNLTLQQNLGQTANNRDYIDDRQNQIVLKTRNDNQLKYGGDGDKYAARDNTRTRFVPGTGYIPNAKLNKNTGKNIQYDDGPLGFVPVVGDVLQGGQAVSDFKNKNYKKAALNAGLLFLPNTLERLGKPVVKGVSKVLGDKLSYLKKTFPYFDDKTINNIIKGEGNKIDDAFRTIDNAYNEIPNLHLYGRDELSEIEENINKNRTRLRSITNPNATDDEITEAMDLINDINAKQKVLDARNKIDNANSYINSLKDKYAPAYHYRDPFDIEPEFSMGGKYHKRKRC